MGPLNEKAFEKKMIIYAAFMDLEKVHDHVDRAAL